MKESNEFRRKVRELHGTGESEIRFITMPDGEEMWYYTSDARELSGGGNAIDICKLKTIEDDKQD
tara:strand:+ start:517 stop:711 length:195 start_codon:yes stop_codon:yes gene_type:complete